MPDGDLETAFHRNALQLILACAAERDRQLNAPLFFAARVAELVDAYGSGPYGETRGGSSPLVSTLARLGNGRFLAQNEAQTS